MFLRWLKAVVFLPGMVFLIVPASILYGFRGTPWAHTRPSSLAPLLWIATLIAFLGAGLALWTMSLFLRYGDGTAAPWDPPRRFIVRGPYRHVRNPMITAVFLLLAAESLALASWPLAAWLVLFVAGNAVYIPTVEEPRLVQRFGDDYIRYSLHVPRWVPRLTPWQDSPN